MGVALKKKLRKRSEELSKKGSGKIPYFLIKEGITRMRLVPTPPEDEFAIEATFFWLGEKAGGGVISPATFNEPCAIMETYLKLKGSKKEEDRELAKKIAPKKRYFALHYKYSDEKGKKVDFESGVKLAILTGQLYQSIIDLYLDEEAGDMTHPKTGYDLKYKRTGSGQFDTEYSVIACKPTPINSKFKGKIYDPVKELKKITPTYEETEDFVSKIIGTPEKKVKKKGKLLKKKKRVS